MKGTKLLWLILAGLILFLLILSVLKTCNRNEVVSEHSFPEGFAIDSSTLSEEEYHSKSESTILEEWHQDFGTGKNNEIDQKYTYAGKPLAENYPNPLSILYNECFALGYDEIRGAPAWVAYRVFTIENYSTDPRPSRFLIDERTQNRVSHNDYTNSGYDRGHMAPNFAISSRYGANCQRETFLMTNIIPQKPNLNQHWWARLERLIARNYSEKYNQVWVITGPVYLEKGKWINEKVKIACHNFKIIKAENGGELIVKAFLVGQEVSSGDPHEHYLTSVRHIEELTGLNFNPLWKPCFADSIETAVCPAMWN